MRAVLVRYADFEFLALEVASKGSRSKLRMALRSLLIWESQAFRVKGFYSVDNVEVTARHAHLPRRRE
jgi:hypothetical protein